MSSPSIQSSSVSWILKHDPADSLQNWVVFLQVLGWLGITTREGVIAAMHEGLLDPLAAAFVALLNRIRSAPQRSWDQFLWRFMLTALFWSSYGAWCAKVYAVQILLYFIFEIISNQARDWGVQRQNQCLSNCLIAQVKIESPCTPYSWCLCTLFTSWDIYSELVDCACNLTLSACMCCAPSDLRAF